MSTHQDPPGCNAPNPNRTRDHLANERTYLAWIRSAIALIGFGVVIVRLRYLLPAPLQTHGNGWELGLVFAILGVLMVVFSAAHYFHVRHAIETDTFEPSARWVVVCTAALALLGTGVIYYLYTSPVLPPASAFHLS